MWVVTFDQVDLPVSEIVFERLFSLDGLSYIVEFFEPDQAVDAERARKDRTSAGSMTADTSHEAIGHPNIERSARLTRSNVDPIRLHGGNSSSTSTVCCTMDPRAKPEDDTFSVEQAVSSEVPLHN
jgi:hypothetical protein